MKQKTKPLTSFHSLGMLMSYALHFSHAFFKQSAVYITFLYLVAGLWASLLFSDNISISENIVKSTFYGPVPVNSVFSAILYGCEWLIVIYYGFTALRDLFFDKGPFVPERKPNATKMMDKFGVYTFAMLICRVLAISLVDFYFKTFISHSTNYFTLVTGKFLIIYLVILLITPLLKISSHTLLKYCKKYVGNEDCAQETSLLHAEPLK